MSDLSDAPLDWLDESSDYNCEYGKRVWVGYWNESRTHVVAELALHKYRGVQGCLSSELDHYEYYKLTWIREFRPE